MQRPIRWGWILAWILAAALILAGCGRAVPEEATPTPVPSVERAPSGGGEGEPLYLVLMWHQHQPFYYKDPETGVYTRPWVRVHATKDYYDMVAILDEYPGVKATFNLTPSLIRQLEDLASGAKDLYWVLAEKPADQLTDEEKRFILRRFFDANWEKVIGRFPRYRELLDKRGRSADPETIERALQTFTEQDFRDLQVWFNLAWFDPDFLAQEPLKALVEKGRDFTEADKEVLFNEVRRVLKEVIPKHREVMERGQIEVTTSPYAHPILPLLYDTNLAAVGDPTAPLPERFSYPNDALGQLERAVEMYTERFGRAPKGLWPSEGAVAQEIVPLVAKAGFVWMATGEDVLAASLDLGSFERDGKETVQKADLLYRPYYVEGPNGERVAVFFRDRVISDKVGFTYSGMDGEAAARDLMERLRRIRDRLREEGAQGPHVVTILLDGENAWEHYPNDGKKFLHALYRNLSEADWLETVTPSEYLERFPEQRTLERLFPGAWFSQDYGTWIGEPEENLAWEYLGRTRRFLAQYDIAKRKEADPEALAKALDYMYLAEGSDWFWWYGRDQDSGNDEYFDFGFRSLLKEVYRSLGAEPPLFLDAPIVSPNPVTPQRSPQALFTPQIDGVAGEGEWAQAGVLERAGGAQARSDDRLQAVYYGFDRDHLYVRIDGRRPWAGAEGLRVGVYLSSPRSKNATPFSRLEGEGRPSFLGLRATHLAEVALGVDGGVEPRFWSVDRYGDWTAARGELRAAAQGTTLELAIPLELLGELEVGDPLKFAILVQEPARDLDRLPAEGPLQTVLPELRPVQALLTVEDPEGDDHGPGSYTYPTDSVFKKQVFDLKTFLVGQDDENLVFRFTLYGPIPNPWGSPIGLSLQTFDVYIDVDPGAGTGRRLLLPGRNAALEAGNGWEYAIWAEGWTQEIWAATAEGEMKKVKGSFKVVVDPDRRTVTIRVPKALFGEKVDPASWGYAAAVLSQEGFPAPGVWRVRDVERQASQWRMGGAPDDVNHTRIVDLAWPADATPTQEEILSTYPPSQTADVDVLGPDDFAQVPLLRP